METDANRRVAQLRADAAAKADATALFLEGLTVEQAGVKTEIGWTVAATAAHLAAGAGFGAMQLKQLKRGKAPTVPVAALNAINFVMCRTNRTKPLADSVTKLREHTRVNLALLDGWTDDELETPYKKPYFGATTYEQGLRNALIRHFDEHMDQVVQALAKT